MAGSAAPVAYLILAVFLGGVTIGVVAMVAVAVRREDRLFPYPAPRRASRRAARDG